MTVYVAFWLAVAAFVSLFFMERTTQLVVGYAMFVAAVIVATIPT